MKIRRLLPVLSLFLAVTAVIAIAALRTTFHANAMGRQRSAAGRLRAPDFPKGYAWLNTAQPLSFKKQLKGQVVLLDFWTYCCINCIHILPMLDHLQHEFRRQPFVIIGVHSNKFTEEGEAANIRAAVQRYKITHPVIVDQHMHIWNAYGVNAWPTLVLIDSTGHIVGSVSGEGHARLLRRAIKQALAQGRRNHTLAAAPLKFTPATSVPSAGGLSFPGKVLADPAGHRLFIADSDHNRIVETSWPNARGHAKLLAIFGDGHSGMTDGPADHASFNNPQGMALRGQFLYVADTGNNLIRRINLRRGRVHTVLGTGRQSNDTTGGRAGRKQGLNSPWALKINGDDLLIAMAGEHQIWAMNLRSHVAAPIAGSGAENLRNGVGVNADFAQPSGLARIGHNLYVADSEDSGIRQINLHTLRVSTIAGHGLFIFGDVNGGYSSSRFQHPLGIAAFGKDLLVADTYNNQLRLVNPRTRQVGTFLGTGKPGAGTPGGTLQFFEPGGLSVAGNTIFVADTNNQRVVIINAGAKAWRQLVIDGLTPPRRTRRAAHYTPTIAAAGAQINPNHPLRLSIPLTLPPRTHFTPGAPLSISIKQGAHVLAQETLTGGRTPVVATVSLGALREAARHDRPHGKPWTVRLFYTYCSEGPASACRPGTTAYRATVTFNGHGWDRWTIRAKRQQSTTRPGQ